MRRSHTEWAIEGLSVEDSINMHVEAWADLDSFGMDGDNENG